MTVNGYGFFGGRTSHVLEPIERGLDNSVNTLKATGLDTLNGKTGVWIIAQEI